MQLLSIHDFATGSRVQLQVACDDWMKGDKYGTVVNISRRKVRVKLDKSGKTKLFPVSSIYEIVPTY